MSTADIATISSSDVTPSERPNNQSESTSVQWPSSNYSARTFSGFASSTSTFQRSTTVRLPQSLTIANVDPDDTEDDNATLILASSTKPVAPPNCRLFVVCAKCVEKAPLKQFFQAYGEVKQVFIIKDKQTKVNKGCAFVTFTSSYPALRALEAVNEFSPLLKGKTLKARLARNPSNSSGTATGSNNNPVNEEVPPDETEQSRYLDKLKKLRISVQPTDTEDSLNAHFSEFGTIEFVNIVRNSATLEPSGSAIIKFEKPSSAAKAVETNTVARFHPVIAATCPASDYTVKCTASSAKLATFGGKPSPQSSSVSAGCTPVFPENPSVCGKLTWEQNMMASTILGLPHRDLVVRYDSSLTNEQLYKLFDIVPGLEEIKLGGADKTENKDEMACCFPKYKTPLNALYAKEKLNGFEYPVGKFITVCFKSNFTTTDGVIALSDPATTTTSTTISVPNQNGAQKPQNFPCSYWNSAPNFQGQISGPKMTSNFSDASSTSQYKSNFGTSGKMPQKHTSTMDSSQRSQQFQSDSKSNASVTTQNQKSVESSGCRISIEEMSPSSGDLGSGSEFLNGASDCFSNDDFDDEYDNDDDGFDDNSDQYVDTSHYWNPPPPVVSGTTSDSGPPQNEVSSSSNLRSSSVEIENAETTEHISAGSNGGIVSSTNNDN